MSLKCWIAMTIGDACLLASGLIYRLYRRMARVMAREIERRGI